MIPAPYLEIWRAMSPEEKKAERWRWVLDFVGGFGLIGFMVAGFFAMDAAAAFCRALGYCL